jgi:cytoskeletal protein RodZ
MNLAEIQHFKQVGKRLRSAREMRGLSLTKISGACGLGIQELVRIENGELMGFKQTPEKTLSNAESYAKILEVNIGNLDRQHSEGTKESATSDDYFIPVFLRKK